MDPYTPPYTITNQMLADVSSISERLGKISITHELDSKPHLRKNNRIKSIHSSLHIEANPLSLGQVRDVINDRLVLGDRRISRKSKMRMPLMKSFPRRIAMEGWCGCSTPPCSRNGNPFSNTSPIESQIEKFQNEYYAAIAACHTEGRSNTFIEFILAQIDHVLDELTAQIQDSENQLPLCVKKLLDVMEYNVPYTATTLMEKLSLKSRNALRNNCLAPAIQLNLIGMTLPNKPNSRKQQYMKT